MPPASRFPRPCPIAIIGMDCLFPDAQGLHEYWRLIRRGEDAVTDVPQTHWKVSDYYPPGPDNADRVDCKRGAFLSPTVFDPVEFGIPPATLEAIDTSQLLALVVAKRALRDAGYRVDPPQTPQRSAGMVPAETAAPGAVPRETAGGGVAPAAAGGREFDRSCTSVILGVTGMQELALPLGARLGHPIWRRALREAGVAADVAERVVRQIADAYVPWQENSFPGLLGNVVAGRVANRLNLHGTNCVVDAACASSLGAVYLAALELAAGRSDMVLTGGVDTFNDVFMFMCFSKAQAISPTGDARPFSAEADGTVLGEGVGILVLKRLADAERDGDRIYAIIRGIGTSSDGRSQSIYAPSAAGQARALRNAYRISGIDPATVELVEAHGTGTRIGDVIEFDALKTVYRESRRSGRWCALGSVKSQIGHTKAAAGAASLIKTVLALYHRTLPPTIKVGTPNPRLGLDDSPFYLNIQTRPWFSRRKHPRRAAVSALGFGGSNFHAVLEEHAAGAREPAWDGSVEIVALSAADVRELLSRLDEWDSALAAGLAPGELAQRAARSRSGFSAGDACRLVLVVERGADLRRLVASVRQALTEKGSQFHWSLPNAYYAGPAPAGPGGAPPGKLALLFPGQGSQYVGMGGDLVCHFPEAFEAVAQADADSGESLADRIYPQPALSEPQRQAQQDDLKQTRIAQPALGAISLAMLRVLKRFGIRADFAAGHSFGELVALRAAGRIGDQALRKLARLRGRLMGSVRGERGTMLAVEAPLEELDALLRRAHLGHDAVLANRNSPTQGIVSGLRKAVEKVARLCDQRGWRTRALEVSAAFHSRVMVPAYERFRAALEDIAFELGRLPVFANVTAGPYPDDPAATRELLARQLVSPVNFVDLVRNLYAAGARTFIEVGPRSVLTGLVKSILHGNPLHALALDAGCGRGNGVLDLARVLALLTALGYGVDLQAWERPAPETVRPSLPIPLLGCNYRSPPAESAPVRTPDPTCCQYRSAPAAAAIADTGCRPEVREEVPETGMSIFQNGPPQQPAAVPTAGRLPEAGSSDQISQALRVLQDGLRSWQALQQQTAAVHERFLKAQEESLRCFQATLEAQCRLIQRLAGLPSPPQVAGDATAPSAAASASVASPPAVAAPAAPASGPPAAGSGADSALSHAEAVLLDIVAEKTGYPRDALRLDMTLDADLGIDIVRRGEIVEALRARLPSFDPVGADSARTLREMIGVPAQAAAADAAAAVAAGDARSAVQTTAAGSTAPTVDPGADGLAPIVLGAVAELTGYPVEMLDLDMDMEADLGIDSIKRLEILGAVQRRLPGLEAASSQYAGSLRTLRNIIDYARGAAAHAAPEPPVTARPVAPPTGTDETPTADKRAGARDLAPATCDALPLGPAARLERRVLRVTELPAARQRPLRIAPGREVWVSDDGTPLAPTLVQRLGARGCIARVVGPQDGWQAAEHAVGGLILLGRPEASDGATWTPQAEEELKLAFRRVQSLARSLREAGAGGGALLATVTRLDGAFGLRGPVSNPVQGGLSGLAKTAAHEWPEVYCRALDVACAWQDADAIANAIIRELCSDGPLEVGLDAARRYGVETAVLPATPAALRLAAGDVVVISGGARGVTAEAAFALAESARPTLVLLGRSPEPLPEPPWLAALVDEADIKRALLKHAFDGRKRPDPAELEAEYRRRIANRQIARNLTRLRAAGCTVIYRPIDVRDAAAVAAALDEARRDLGPVRGLIHGAGVIEDRRIEDKTAAQFDRVFDTKVRGLRSLLEATRDDDLRFIVLFSSVSARFGRTGQVDYAMANEVLNKVAHQQAAARPGCRVVAINWGPWDGGMVTPALKREFARQGIDLIPPAAGARCLLDELCAADADAIEVLIGAAPAGDGTADDQRQVSQRRLPYVRHRPSSGLLRPGLRRDNDLTPAFERRLDLETHAFLLSHVIDGSPVLPMAMMLEWLAHGALHGNPGLLLHAVEDFRVLKGLVLSNGPATIRVYAARSQKVAESQTTGDRHASAAGRCSPVAGQQFIVPVELRSLTGDDREIVHARAVVRLTTSLPDPPAVELGPDLPQQPYAADAAALYREILFHGPHFQGIESVEGISARGMVARARTAPPPGDWMAEPLRTAWLSDPLAIDAGLQLGVLWCHAQRNAVCLPGYAARYSQYRAGFPPGRVTIALEVRDTGAHRLSADLTFFDGAGRVIARGEGCEWTVDAALRRAFANNALPSA